MSQSKKHIQLASKLGTQGFVVVEGRVAQVVAKFCPRVSRMPRRESALSTIPLNGIQFQQELAIFMTYRRDYLLCNDNDKNYLFSGLYFSQSPTAVACREAFGGKGMRLETTGRFMNSRFLWRSIDAAIQIEKATSWPAIVVPSQRQTRNGQAQYVHPKCCLSRKV